LPAHNQPSSNGGRDILGAVDRNSRSFSTHSNTKEKTGDEARNVVSIKYYIRPLWQHSQLIPVLRDSRTNDREEAEDGSEHDST